MVYRPVFCGTISCNCIRTITKEDCNLQMCVGEAEVFRTSRSTVPDKGFYFCTNNNLEGWHRFFIKEEYLGLFASLIEAAKTYKEKS